MKLLDYNVREGLLANYHESRADQRVAAVIDDERYRLLLEFMSDQQADVVQLQELTGWDQNRFDQFQHDAGYPYGVFSPAGTIHHLGVLSKQPIREANDENQYHPSIPAETPWWEQRTFWHALPRTVIGTLSFFNVHLCPQLPEDRLRELEILLRVLPKEQVVISGDFNGLRAHEYPAELFNQLSDKQHRKFGPAGTGNVVDVLAEHGYIDVFAARPDEFTAPTKSNRDPAHGEAPLRLDFVLVSADLEESIGAHSVIRTPQTDQISDHYPVVVELVD